MEKKNIFSRFGSIYNKLEETILVSSLVLNVLLVLSQVVMRTIFRHSLTWSEELSRYIFIWQIWLGASVALKYHEHLRVTVIFTFLESVRVQAFIRLLADIIWFLFCAYMVVNGIQLLFSMASRNAISSGLQMPLVYVYLVFPLSSFLICVRLLGELYNDLIQFFGRQDGGEAE